MERLKRLMPWRPMLYTYLECWGICFLSFWVPIIVMAVSEGLSFKWADLFFNIHYCLLLGAVMALLLGLAMLLLNGWNIIWQKCYASYGMLYIVWLLLLIGTFVGILNTELFTSMPRDSKTATMFITIMYSCLVLPIVMGLCFIFFRKNKPLIEQPSIEPTH